jgi:hypothetical protein
MLASVVAEHRASRIFVNPSRLGVELRFSPNVRMIPGIFKRSLLSLKYLDRALPHLPPESKFAIV